MFTKSDIKTIEQLLTIMEYSPVDKMEGNLSNDRKVTVYKVKLQDTLRMDIRRIK